MLGISLTPLTVIVIWLVLVVLVPSYAVKLILLVPLVLILPFYYGLDGIFYSFPISDFLSTIIIGIMIWFEFKNLNKKIVQDS